MSREFLRNFVGMRMGEPMLEIGPFMNPFISKGIFDVSYADIRSKEEIYEYYLSHNLCAPETLHRLIHQIDYVIKDTYVNAVQGKQFSLVFSSHVIEHVTDIIAHFRDLSSILTDGGFIVLAVPDKRYTFDYFREVTPFRDMIDVYASGTNNSLARLGFDQAFTCHPVNEPSEYSAGNVSFSEVAASQARFDDAMALYKRVRDEGTILSDHNWVFTDASFLDFIRDGLRSRLLPFTLHYFDGVEQGGNEFTAILQKDAGIPEDNERLAREIQMIVRLSESGR